MSSLWEADDADSPADEGDQADGSSADAGDDQPTEGSEGAAEPDDTASTETGDMARGPVDNDDPEVVFTDASDSADSDDAADGSPADPSAADDDAAGRNDRLLVVTGTSFPCFFGGATFLPLTAFAMLAPLRRRARRRGAGVSPVR